MRVRLDDGITIDTHLFKYMGADVDRHDNVRVFVRRYGQKRRIRDLSGLEVFVVEYRRLLDRPSSVKCKAEPAAPGSMRWLIERYYDSGDYHMQEESTRAWSAAGCWIGSASNMAQSRTRNWKRLTFENFVMRG